MASEVMPDQDLKGFFESVAHTPVLDAEAKQRITNVLVAVEDAHHTARPEFLDERVRRGMVPYDAGELALARHIRETAVEADLEAGTVTKEALKLISNPLRAKELYRARPRAEADDFDEEDMQEGVPTDGEGALAPRRTRTTLTGLGDRLDGMSIDDASGSGFALKMTQAEHDMLR